MHAPSLCSLSFPLTHWLSLSLSLSVTHTHTLCFACLHPFFLGSAKLWQRGKNCCRLDFNFEPVCSPATEVFILVTKLYILSKWKTRHGICPGSRILPIVPPWHAGIWLDDFFTRAGVGLNRLRQKLCRNIFYKLKFCPIQTTRLSQLRAQRFVYEWQCRYFHIPLTSGVKLGKCPILRQMRFSSTFSMFSLPGP